MKNILLTATAALAFSVVTASAGPVITGNGCKVMANNHAVVTSVKVKPWQWAAIHAKLAKCPKKSH